MSSSMEFFTSQLWLQVALGGGYLGYAAAYAGIRAHHKQMEVVFLTAAFGVIAALVLSLVAPLAGNWVAVPIAVLLAVLAGLAWRVRGRALWAAALRHLRVSFSDEAPTVLARLAGDTDHDVSQVLVLLDDGTEMFCDNLAAFADAPFRGLVIGDDGGVGLYVTQVYRPAGAEPGDVRQAVRDAEWGDRLTYVPAGRVRAIELRYRRRD